MSLTKDLIPFLSGIPDVKLVNAFSRPFENAVATARTCYSAKGIVTAEEVSGDFDPDKRQQKAERRDALAQSIYKAGHHTTLQHAHFQFALNNVSRHFIWSFLHAHPYYNSEQVSQRYVEVKPGSFVVPPVTGKALEIYEQTTLKQTKDYKKLTEILMKPAGDEYFKIFPARDRQKYLKDVKKKSQEVARYVLPIGTTGYLYHSISGITLLRYWRAAKTLEASQETLWVIGRMVEELIKYDPLYAVILESPLEEISENEIFDKFIQTSSTSFRNEFDADLNGKVSLLVDWKQHNEKIIADSVREVVGLCKNQLSDTEAIDLVLNPAKNRLLGETMNLTTLSKLSRTLVHAAWTFKKKLSHTADSQDQRHRMTPASRPFIALQLAEEPDYITPELIKKDQTALNLYKESIEDTWQAFLSLKKLISPDLASYLLPNALSIRFTESADLLNLHHKMKMRLCYNSQEEIWRASLDEVKQIRNINPNIGKYLLPPCGIRKLSKSSPICPEGDRYCGVPVWRLTIDDYERTI